MQLISKGYGTFSGFLVLVGVGLSYMFWSALGPMFLAIKNTGFGKPIMLFGLGIPFVILNIWECKYVWGRVLDNHKIDLFGVSLGFMIGLIIAYCLSGSTVVA